MSSASPPGGGSSSPGFGMSFGGLTTTIATVASSPPYYTGTVAFSNAQGVTFGGVSGNMQRAPGVTYGADGAFTMPWQLHVPATDLDLEGLTDAELERVQAYEMAGLRLVQRAAAATTLLIARAKLR